MRRNPMVALRAEMRQVARQEASGSSGKAQPEYDQEAGGRAGQVETDGTVVAYGLFDLTPLDAGDGFRVS